MAKKAGGEAAEYQDLRRATDEAQAAISQTTNTKVIEAFAEINSIMNTCNKENDEILKSAGIQGKTIHIRLKTGAKEKLRNGTQMTYLNPHTKETITTAGHNHKLLKEWKAKWGKDVVKGWIQ